MVPFGLAIPLNTPCWKKPIRTPTRSEEHTSELQSHHDRVCRLLLEKKKPGEDGAEGTPGEDGAGSTPGEDGAGSTPGEDGVDSVNGAMSLRYLCRCCCSSRRRSSS